LWIIGLGIDASWKFPTRKSQSRVPVANCSARYVYESTLPRARAGYIWKLYPIIQPRDSKKFTAATYRVTNVRVLKMWRLKFHKKMSREIRLCAHRCSITTPDTKPRQERAFKSLSSISKVLPNKFKFCYANKRDVLFTNIINVVRIKLETNCYEILSLYDVSFC